MYGRIFLLSNFIIPRKIGIRVVAVMIDIDVMSAPSLAEIYLLLSGSTACSEREPDIGLNRIIICGGKRNTA